MKPRTAELLLVLYFILPIGARHLVALVLISQIKAIHLVRYAEKRLDIEDDSTAIDNFFRILWLDPSNSAAYAYLGVFHPCPVFPSHQNGDRITASGSTLIGQTSSNVTVKLKITLMLSLLGGLFSMGDETLLEEEVNADENGHFQVQVPVTSVIAPGTRYTIFASVSSNLYPNESTQMTLVQSVRSARAIAS